jgi:hypothetical protein
MNNILIYTIDREAAAQFVEGILLSFGKDLQSITITPAEKLEDFSVSIVIDTSLDGTVRDWVQTYYGLRCLT